MKTISIILLLFLAFSSQVFSQNQPISLGYLSNDNHPGATSIDTIPSWIVYIDSVRMFAGAPEFDLRVEVAPGWTVQKRTMGPFDIDLEETYYDTNGIKFDPDIVLFTNRRKVVYNKFRQ